MFISPVKGVDQTPTPLQWEYTFYDCNCDLKGEYLKALIPVEMIERKIYLIRGQKVMLDSELAELYQVPTKRLTE